LSAELTKNTLTQTVFFRVRVRNGSKNIISLCLAYKGQRKKVVNVRDKH